MTDSRDLSFWRNLAFIAVAHLAVLFGVTRWGGEVKRASPANVVWLAGGGALAAPAPAVAGVTLVQAPAEEAQVAEPEEEKAEPMAAPEREMRSAIAAPTAAPRATPKATTPPRPKPSAAPTPKAGRKPKAKKTLLAKASPKPTAAPVVKEAEERSAEKQTGTDAESTAKGGAASAEQASGAAGASQFNWYGSMLHDRFHGEWVQPKTAAATGSRMSTVVQFRIEKDGRVSDFRIVRSSGNVVVDESVNAVSKRVTQVDPPPTPLVAAGHYDVRINFELNVE